MTMIIPNDIRSEDRFYDEVREVPVSIDGVDALLRYKEYASMPSLVPSADMVIQLDDARRLQGLPTDVRINYIYILQGEMVLKKIYIGYGHFDAFSDGLRAYDRDNQAIEFRKELDVLKAVVLTHERQGLPIDRALSLVRQAERVLTRFGFSRSRKTSMHDVQSVFKALRNELDRLATTDSTELLVDGLLDGTVSHFDVTHNHEVIAKVATLSIRSAGFIEPITEDILRRFYEQRISDLVVKTIQGIQSYSLRLCLEDYAPAALVNDPELELAPETVFIQNGSRETSYVVHYDLVEVEGESIPVGIITIPVSLYQKLGYVYGKKSQFPELPHGIRMMLDVRQQGQRVALGFDGDELVKKVQKFQRGKNRSAALADVAKSGYSHLVGDLTATPVPSWYKGARIR